MIASLSTSTSLLSLSNVTLASSQSSTLSAGVSLPVDTSGSQFLHQLLAGATQHPSTAEHFSGIHIPESAGAFRKSYADDTIQFEGTRIASGARVAIARAVTDAAQDQMIFRTEGGRVSPLPHYMLGRQASALPTVTHNFSNQQLQALSLPWNDEVLAGTHMMDVIDEHAEQRQMSDAAFQALNWLYETHRDENGQVNLCGRKIVLLGAGAELSPLPLFLNAGATVLWMDLKAPPAEILNNPNFSGTLVYPEHGADLLQQPLEIAATIREFAGDQKVSIGSFAYVGGKAREWRLTSVMNAITRQLANEGRVDAIGTFISPTSPAAAQLEDYQAGQRHLAGRAWTHAANLGWIGASKLLGRVVPNYASFDDDVRMVQALVPLQGPTYIGAQYVEKIMIAEAMRALFPDVTVSANVAGISRTKSLSIPVFEAGYIGARMFGLSTYDPATTVALNGMMLLHDWMNPEAPGSARRQTPFANDNAMAAALLSQQVHGGIYSFPYALNGIIELAAIRGFLRKPSLVKGMLGRKKKR